MPLDFIEMLEKTLQWFTPDYVPRQPIKADLWTAAHMKGSLALLVIDVQEQFCKGDEHMEGKAARIASIVPEFRKAGVPVYAIYMAERNEPLDYCRFVPDANDKIIRKLHSSSFIETGLHRLLQKNGKKSLLVCGFERGCCVAHTVSDAQEQGYDACLLGDMTDTHRTGDGIALKKLREDGMDIAGSREMLDLIARPGR